MPLPAISEVAHEYLFYDADKLAAMGYHEATIRHLVRLRDIYSYWLSFPSKKDRDIVCVLKSRYGISETAARADLRLIKVLLGNFQKTSKDYHRYRFSVMINKAYDKADMANNTRDMVAAAAQYARYFALDKEDEQDGNIAETIVPVVLKFTDDPEAIGFKKIPDAREKIKKLKKELFTETTQFVEYEEIDAELDSLFKPEMPEGYANDSTTAGLPE